MEAEIENPILLSANDVIDPADQNSNEPPQHPLSQKNSAPSLLVEASAEDRDFTIDELKQLGSFSHLPRTPRQDYGNDSDDDVTETNPLPVEGRNHFSVESLLIS
jgi:hypothetical protein